jgi:hypothetical protein
MSLISNNQHNQVIIKEIPINECTGVIDSWKKQVQAIKNETLSQQEVDNIKRYKSVLTYALIELNKKSSRSNITIYVAKNDFGIQGILIGHVAKNTLMIDELATAPGNFSSVFLKDGWIPLKGVGTGLFEHAKAKAQDMKLSRITLRYFEGAKGFYKRLGMTQTEQGFSLPL